jgi:hypothetical protein
MLLVITAVPPGKFWNTSLNRPRMISSITVPVFLLVYHSLIGRHELWDTDVIR